MRLLEDVHTLGGRLTTAGGRRSLRGKAGKNRSMKSMHYVGRAFDLALDTGMHNPSRDQYICEDGWYRTTRCFRGWCRSSLPYEELVSRASATRLGEAFGGLYVDGDITGPSETRRAVKVVTKRDVNGRAYTEIGTEAVTPVAFDFTGLAAAHGFYGIRARKSFFRGGSYGGAEGWHFQNTSGLIEGETTFGEDLMRVYSQEECERFLYWEQAKGAVWQENWF